MKKILPILIAILLCAAPASAATYTFYIDQDGGTDNNCTSPSTSTCTSSGAACQTTKCADELINNASGGDSVTIYFECGDTWIVDATDETIDTKPGVTTKLSSYEGATLGAGCSGSLPTFDANDTADLGQSGFNGWIVRLQDDDDTLEYIRIQECYANCVKTDGSIDDMSGTGPIVQYCEIEQAGWGCLMFYTDIGFIARYNDVSECGYGGNASQVSDAKCATYGNIWSCCPSSCTGVADRFTPATHPNAIDSSYGEEDCQVIGNRVYNSWTEGIGGVWGCTVKDNVLWNIRAPSIYVNSGSVNGVGNTLVENNLCFADTDLQLAYCNQYTLNGRSDWCAACIRVNDENDTTPGAGGAGDTHAGVVTIKNNISIGLYAGINLMNTYYATYEKIEVFNNSLYDNGNNLRYQHTNHAGWTDVDTRNNFSWISDENDSGGTGYCVHAWNNEAINGVFSFDYTAWDGDDTPDSDFTGSNDESGDAKLGKTSGWLSLTSIPTTADLIVGPGSITIDNGLDLGTGTGLDPSNTDFTTTPPTVATLNQDSYGAGWEIGAFVYDPPPPGGGGIVIIGGKVLIGGE